KSQCTTRRERRITGWERRHLLEAVQPRLDANPTAIRQRASRVDVRALKAGIGATRFLTKLLSAAAAAKALSVNSSKASIVPTHNICWIVFSFDVSLDPR